ncbi:Gfo/Idh/MocA family protein [Rariglobus hedericola]|uniref:Gfo/Idh/MocA family oxidoreductase n=1 Tax=Rariglobus hedericola TaxID=2597822 RepID=A0A556QRM8_9BACT|nr:Gfo/Idh/MocA family oxidoreductase [Rariglobus hedericola]TSJ79282.1 Gfo/Idh/MocA family oxidoreductase [Rariglobus hedericola]
MSETSIPEKPLVRIALIGLGAVGQQHLDSATKLIDGVITVVCDARVEVAESTATAHNIPRWTASADDVLADPDVDAVLLALPTGIRTPLAIAALHAGKHILIEKPVAMNAAEVRSILDAQGDRIAACCSSRLRYFSSARAARDHVASGALGPIRAITCRVIAPAGAPPAKTPPAWRLSRALNGGGILVNWGSYDLDYLLGILGFDFEPTHVLARTWQTPPPFSHYPAPGSDAETHVVATIGFTNGAVLHYERAECAIEAESRSWRISGDHGALILQMAPSKGAVVQISEPDPARGTVTRTLWEGDESGWATFNDGPLLDFATAIRQNRPPLTSLRDSLLIARLTEGIYRSADTGRPVSFSDL